LGEEKQIVNYPGKSVSLMQKRREFFVDLRFEILACQQSFEAYSKNSDRALQLVGGISGISGRSFQFVTGRGEGSFGAFSARTVFF
jgi:hypothetical protein